MIVAALGVLLLWGLALYASRCLDAREDARIALAAVAHQHAWVLAGDERGTYGEYDPADVEQAMPASVRATANVTRSQMSGCHNPH